MYARARVERHISNSLLERFSVNFQLQLLDKYRSSKRQRHELFNERM